MVPDVRVRRLNDRAPASRGRYVLYWMVAARRLRFNFGLQRAVEWAQELGLPLLVYEPLRCGYPHATDRVHRFIIDGMCDHEEALRESEVLYYPYVEPRPGAAKGMLGTLAEKAAVVVTDDAWVAFISRMIEAAGPRLPVLVEAVDSNGLLPVRATRRVFQTAASFRAYLRKSLGEHLAQRPKENPLKVQLPPLKSAGPEVERRWQRAAREMLDGDPNALRRLPIDHAVAPSPIRGGPEEAQKRLRYFVRALLPDYAQHRQRPEVDGTSRLSPYLHFGQLGVHEVLRALERREGRRLTLREGAGALFAASPEVESFLDELVTWRELALNMASKRTDAGDYHALPEWARATLRKHRSDRRPRVQRPEALEQARTQDPVFDAAQRQLAQEGWFPNAMRMIWGKKILEYSRTPEEAFATLRRLMDRYSLDGRDPNSIAGAAWVFGRYDRPWGPERPIFGTVRYMTSDTKDKLRRYRAYVDRYALALAPEEILGRERPRGDEPRPRGGFRPLPHR